LSFYPPNILKKPAPAAVFFYMDLLSSGQVSRILGVSRNALSAMVSENKIPAAGGYFSRGVLSDWLKKGPEVMTDEDACLDALRKEWEEQYPEAIAALREYDRKLTAALAARREGRRGKDYYLVKEANKKQGFRYYVRYRDKGKLLPSKWSTKTNIRAEAEQFAETFRGEILAEYYSRAAAREARPERRQAEGEKPRVPEPAELYQTLETGYKRGSAYLAAAEHRGRVLGAKTVSVYDHFMNKKFIPFLREQGVASFAGVTPPVIFNLQDRLLAGGNIPGTVNRYLGSVKAVFDYLFMKGLISENAFDRAKMLKTGGRKARTVRGCLESGRVRGAFNTPWENRRQYLLCLMIYATGMRNSEIEKIRVKDIIAADGVYFIDAVKSKTGNGRRTVPLHPFVYKELAAYAKNLHPESYIFSAKGNHNQSTEYRAANEALGERIGMSAEQMKEQKITYYSGRHFWKTVMNAGGLGEDVEEYFMGHKVSGDVRKRYNHKDKQGKEKLLEKAREIFAVLDKELFESG
jgi:integrase